MNEKIYIQGLHCASCEILLEKELMKIKEIQNCKISHRKGTLEVECKDRMPMHKIKQTVDRCGYRVVTEGQKKTKIKKNTIEDYMQLIFIFLGIATIAYIIQKFEITRFFPDFQGQSGIFISLLLGLVASLSTCLILVGGIVLSFGNIYKVQDDTKHPMLSKSLPHIYFHIGRIGGFAFLGGLLGLLGSKINYSLSFTGYLTIFVAIVMLYVGLQILGIVPSITKLGFHLPKKFSKKIHTLQEKNHSLAPILIGVLTFLLPCGFTQSMQLAAIASGNFFSGALIMGFFAIGTFPALFSLGLGSSYAQKSDFKFFNKIVGAIVIFFAIYSLNSGLVLSGSNFTLNFWNNQSAIESAYEGDVQIIKMDVNYGFSANKFVVKKGIPVKFEIEGINVTGCSNEIAIPRLGISQKINKGENVIEFTPTETGTLPFSCWMGMLGGEISVID